MSRKEAHCWTKSKMSQSSVMCVLLVFSSFLLCVTLSEGQGQSPKIEWVSYALGPNTEVWTPNMPAVRTPRAGGQQRRFFMPPPPPTLRPPIGPPPFPASRALPSAPNNQNSNRKVPSLPPQPRTPNHDHLKNNHHRPVSQQTGHLHDSWPKSNTHHHLSNPPAPPTNKNWPTKIRLSNTDLRMPSAGESQVNDPSKVSITTEELSKSHLTASQKEKIIQMTNTLTKLSPKKPINVFMRHEGIAATRAGADVGQVIKKYAGSSKVPFFNGTLPGSNLPSVFLAPEDTKPPYGYGKIPIPSLKPGKDQMPKMDEATLVQGSLQVGGTQHSTSTNSRSDTFLGPASMPAPPGYTKILLPPGSSPLKSKGSGSITMDTNTKSLNTLTTDEKLKIIQALRQGKTPQVPQNTQQFSNSGPRFDSGYKIVQGPALDPSADPLSLLKGVLPQGAIVESIQSLGGGLGDTQMAGSIATPNVVKPPPSQQYQKVQQQLGQQQFPKQNQQWPQTQGQQQWQQPPLQQQWPPVPQQSQSGNGRQPNAQQNFGNLNLNQQKPNNNKVVVNPGIQISLPKVQDGGFSENELTKIIGEIVKQTEGPSSTTPMPFGQQQWNKQVTNNQLHSQFQNNIQPAQRFPPNWSPTNAPPMNQNFQQQWNPQKVQQQFPIGLQNQQGQQFPQAQMIQNPQLSPNGQQFQFSPQSQTGQQFQLPQQSQIGQQQQQGQRHQVPLQMNQQQLDQQKQTLVFPPGYTAPQSLFPPRTPAQQNPVQTQNQQNKGRLPVLIPPPPSSTPAPPRPPTPMPTEVKPQGIPMNINPSVDQRVKGQGQSEERGVKQQRQPTRAPLLQTALSFLGIQSTLPPVISGKPMGNVPRRPPANHNHERPANQNQERRRPANQEEDPTFPPNQERHPPNQNEERRRIANQNQERPANQNEERRRPANQNQERRRPANQEREGPNQEMDDSDSSESTEVEVREKPSTTIVLSPPGVKGHGKGSREHNPQTIVIQGGSDSNLGNLRRIITSLNNEDEDSASEEGPPVPPIQIPTQPPPRPFLHASPSPLPQFSTPLPLPWQNPPQRLPTVHPPQHLPQMYPSSTPRPSPLLPLVSSPFPPLTFVSSPTPRPNTLFSSTPFYPSSTPMTFISSTPGTYVSSTPGSYVSSTPGSYVSSTPATYVVSKQPPVQVPQPITILAPSQGQLGMFTLNPSDMHANAIQNVMRQNMGLSPLQSSPTPTSYLYNPTAGTLTPVQGIPPSHSQTATYQLITQTIPTTTTTTTTTTPTTTTTTQRPRKSSSEENPNSLQGEPKKDEDKVIEKVRTEEKIIWNGSVPSKIRTQERTIIRPHQTAQSIRHEERVKFKEEKVKGQKEREDSLFSNKDFSKSSEEQPFTTVPPEIKNSRHEGSKVKSGGSKHSKSKPESGYPQDSNVDSTNPNEQYSAGSIPDVQGSIRVNPAGTSFSELLTSKMKFEKMKEQLYPHHPISPVPGPTPMGGWPLFESFPMQPFSTPSPGPTSTEGSTTLDPNGRHKVRSGDLMNSQSMTPITSITPSHFDPAFQQYMASQNVQEQYAYMMGTSPQPVGYNGVQGVNPVGYNGMNPGDFRYPYHQKSPSLAENKREQEKSAQNPNEKLIFIPSAPSSGEPKVKVEEKKEEQRLLFFPSSSPMPLSENPSSRQSQNSGLEIGADMQIIGDTPIWEPFRNNGPSVDPVTLKTTTTTTTTPPTTTTTTTTEATTTTQKTTTTQTPSTTKPTTTTESTTTKQDERSKPSTWRPPHIQNPTTAPPVPPSPLSSYERSKSASVGAGTLHALMRSMTFTNNQWQHDTSHMEPKDIGASVLYAVSNGLPMPLPHQPNHAHFQNHMLMQPENNAMLQQPILLQYQMPYLSPSAQPHFSQQSPSAQPHFNSQSPSAQPQFNSQSPSAQPFYTIPSPSAQPQYNLPFPSAQPQFNLLSPSAQPQFVSPSAQPVQYTLDEQQQQEYYNYNWEGQEETTTQPTTTPANRIPEEDKPRYRTRFRIPPSAQALEAARDPHKLIPVYVHKNRKHRVRTTTTTTTTTEAPFSDEYEDENTKVGLRKQPSQYEDTDEDKMAPVRTFVHELGEKEEKKEPVRYLYDFSASAPTVQTTATAPEKETEEETIYEVRVKTPASPSRPKFTKFSSGSDESNELDMNIYQNNYFQMGRTTSSTTPSTTTSTTTEKPRRRKGRRKTTTTTTAAPEFEESESESEESPEKTTTSTTTQKPKRRRRPSAHAQEHEAKRVLPPFRASQTAAEYRKTKERMSDQEEFMSPHYAVTRQESVVSKQGAIQGKVANQGQQNKQQQNRRHDTAPQLPSGGVERDMFLLSAEEPNGGRKQGLVSAEDSSPFQLRAEGTGGGEMSPMATISHAEMSPLETFRHAAMSLLSSNLVVKKTGPTMEFLNDDVSPEPSTTFPTTKVTTTTTTTTTPSTTTSATTTSTTPKPTSTTIQPTTAKAKPTAKKQTKSKLKKEKAKPEKTKLEKSGKVKVGSLESDYNDLELKEMLKNLQSKIQATGGLSDYGDLGSAMLDYYDPDDLLQTLKGSPKKQSIKKSASKKSTKKGTKKQSTKKKSSKKKVPAQIKNGKDEAKVKATSLPKPKIPAVLSTTVKTTTAPPTTTTTTTPAPTTTTTTTIVPPVTENAPPEPTFHQMNIVSYAKGTTESNGNSHSTINQANPSRRRIRVVRRRRPQQLPFAQPTFPPMTEHQAPVPDTTPHPFQHTFSSRVGEIEGEPVRRRLKLVRKGNRAQWKLGAEEQSDQSVPLPLVSVGAEDVGQGHSGPERSVRMESSMTVETRVCVRGKCEVVTKN